MSKRYTKEFKQTILDLYKQGKSARQLSLEYEIGYSTVLKWVQGSIKTSPDGLTPDEAKELRKRLFMAEFNYTIMQPKVHNYAVV